MLSPDSSTQDQREEETKMKLTSSRRARGLCRLAFAELVVLAAAVGISGATLQSRPLPWPGNARADLAIPDDRWRSVLDEMGYEDSRLGYTADEMGQFGRDLCLMRTVGNLFRDVRAIPRSSGVRAEGFLTDASKAAAIVERGYLLTDVSAARMLPLPDSSAWGATWLTEGTPPAEALEAMVRYHGPDAPAGGAPGVLADAQRAAWARLPASVQRLVVRLFIGAAEAAPWLQAAYADPCFAELWGGADHTATLDAVYARVTAPWTEERLGQSVTRERLAFRALEVLDREYLAFGSILFLAHLDRGLEEYRRAAPGTTAPPGDFTGCDFETALGMVRIRGTGTDHVDAPAFLTLDLGGDDRYDGRQAVPLSIDRPISLVLDLAGNDRYEGGERPVAVGCGFFGVGVLVDLAGDDAYRAAESGLGAGWFGTGLLLDGSGNDVYVLDTRWGQGAAHAGVGALVDLAGDDRYTCGYEAQGLGSTYGAGVLIDVTGDDRYVARDDGNISALYLNQSVAMSQGCGYGRRADLGDGHSLAGGFGVLVDGAGDDLYHATAWSQGAGYWWGVGILEDLGGNDSYRNGKYSLGAAAHFAIGCQVDLAGNDRYNVGNSATMNQYQGHARDGSIGISIDGDGNDEYFFKSHCAGSGDLNSIGLFWDRRGDDLYRVVYAAPESPTGWNDTPPMGTTTAYPPFRSFRDDLAAAGLFLDTGGEDRYLGDAGSARQRHAWPSHRMPRGWGFGLDANWYPKVGAAQRAR
jgi:hypothetical protein